MPLQEAILQGAGKRVRPMMMTALTAILGLLPAAVSTKIGSQTQRPLAIVVVGGMTMTLFLDRYLMPVLYSFYGPGRRRPARENGALETILLRRKPPKVCPSCACMQSGVSDYFEPGMPIPGRTPLTPGLRKS